MVWCCFIARVPADINIMHLFSIAAGKREQSFTRARLTVPNRFRLMENRSGRKNWTQYHAALTGFVTGLWLSNVKGA